MRREFISITKIQILELEKKLYGPIFERPSTENCLMSKKILPTPLVTDTFYIEEASIRK